MYEYKYVAIKPQRNMISVRFEEHQVIISEYAQQGYRFVGYIPTEISQTGIIIEIELVFEKVITTVSSCGN